MGLPDHQRLRRPEDRHEEHLDVDPGPVGQSIATVPRVHSRQITPSIGILQTPESKTRCTYG